MKRITESSQDRRPAAGQSPAGDSARPDKSGPVRRALSTLILVSRFPVPLKGEPDFSGVPFWLPQVGFAAGAMAAVGYGLASLVFSSGGARAFCALLILYFAFDLFHLDGLLDSADAFMGGGTREKRLEILKDPRVGSFGVFAGIAYLGALWYCATIAATASLPPGLAPVVFLAPVAGRAASALVPVFLPPARPGGLGAMLQPYSRAKALSGLAFSVVLSLAIVWLSAIFSGEGHLRVVFSMNAPLVARALVATGASLSCGVVAGLAPILASYGRKIGGYTGDALGAAIALGTLGYLVCALAILGVL